MAVSFTKVASSWQTPSNSSYSSRQWRAAIVVTVASSSATSYKLKVQLYFDGKKGNWGQVGKYVSGYITFNGSKVKSFSDGAQSWNYTDKTEQLVLTYTSGDIARTTSVRSIPISGSVKVNSPSAYRNGNTSTTASYSYSIPALASFNVIYYDNLDGVGGSSLETRTYYYSKDFSTLPNYTGGTGSTWSLSRQNYEGTGYWLINGYSSTNKISQNDTTNNTTAKLYQALTGSSWTGSSNGSTVKLYAEWKLLYTAPSFSTIDIYRTSNNSGTPTKDPSGTYVYYKITYSNGKYNGQNLSLTLKINDNINNLIEVFTGNTESSGTRTGYLPYTYNADNSLTFNLILSSSGQSDVSKSIGVPAAQYPIDLKVDNNNNISMGIMGPAEDNRPLKLNLSPTGALIMAGANNTTSNYKNCVYYYTGTYSGGTNDTTGNNKYHAFYVNNTGVLYINETFLQFNTGYFRSTYTNSNPSSTTTANLRIESNGDIKKTGSSSRRYKCDIEDANLEVFNPHNLYNIPFRQFRYKEGYFGDNADNNTYNKLYQGFIAEEVQECYPWAVDVEDNGDVETWSDRELIPPMLKLIQEQHEEIEALKSRIEILEANK